MRLKVNKCCCMNLRTGSLVIAWFDIVSFILALVLMYAALIAIMFIPPNENDLAQQDRDLLQSTFVILTVVVTIASLPSLVNNILLIFGIKKRNHYMLLPWLILRFLGLGIYALHALIMVMVAKSFEGLVLMIFKVLIFAFYFWLWLIVYSLYQEMKEARQRDNLTKMQSAYVENGQIDRVRPFEAMEKDPTY